MRISTANNNRRRLERRARRAAVIKRRAARAVIGLFPESRPWFCFDLAEPGSDRTIYGGALGGGKSIVMAELRERMERDPIKIPPVQLFYDELNDFRAMTHEQSRRIFEGDWQIPTGDKPA